jgi:hypothetical protein
MKHQIVLLLSSSQSQQQLLPFGEIVRLPRQLLPLHTLA